MTIINMVGGGASGPKVPLDAISVISAVGGDTEATITWTDPSDIVVNGVTVTTWTATKLVRKAGSAPVNSTDGTLVVTETVRDTYSVSGYTDTGLTNGTIYYYAAFAVGDNGLETISSTTPDITPSQGWTPGANTILFVPMNTDLSDHSSNNITLNNTNVTIANVGGINAGYFQDTNSYYYLNADLSSYISSGDYTVLVWVNALSQPSGSSQDPFRSIWGGLASGPYRGAQLIQKTSGFAIGTEGKSIDTSIVPTLNTWYLVCGVYKTNEGIVYVNGTQGAISSWTLSYGFQNFGIGYDRSDNAGKSRHWRGYMSNFILENRARTAQEISDYYNLTKGNYGL